MVTIKRSIRKSFTAFSLAFILTGWALPAFTGEHSPDVTDLLDRADRALTDGRPREATELAKQALQMEPNSEDVHNELGLCYVHQRQFNEAAAEFKEALKIKPDYTPSLHNLGSVLYRNGLYSEAIGYLKKELEIRNNADPDTLTSLADAYRDRANMGGASKESDYAQALNYYKQAETADPSFSTLHNHLGVFYFQRGQVAEAEDEIKRAIDLKPDYAAAYYNLALVQAKRHKLAEAAVSFRNSLKYETEPEYKEQVRRKMNKLGIPVEAGDFISKSFDLIAQSEWSEAEDVLADGVAGSGRNNAVAWNNLGYVQMKQGKYKESIASYRKAIQLMPKEFSAAQYNLGHVLRLTGDLDGAERCFKKAVADAGGMNALAHNALGLLYKQKKQMEAAKSEYRLAIMQSGDTLPVVHYNLGLVLEKEPTRKQEAISEYQRYLEQSPDGINATAAKTRLDTLKRS